MFSASGESNGCSSRGKGDPNGAVSPPSSGVLIVVWVFLLVDDDSESGLSGLTAMIDSSTRHSQTPAPGVVSAESDWPEPEPSSEIL